MKNERKNRSMKTPKKARGLVWKDMYRYDVRWFWQKLHCSTEGCRDFFGTDDGQSSQVK